MKTPDNASAINHLEKLANTGLVIAGFAYIALGYYTLIIAH